MGGRGAKGSMREEGQRKSAPRERELLANEGRVERETHPLPNEIMAECRNGRHAVAALYMIVSRRRSEFDVLEPHHAQNAFSYLGT